MCAGGGVGGGVGGQSPLKGGAPPHSDRTTLSLDSPPPTHLRTAATAAGPRPPALASYCPQHPGPAGPPIHKYTHTRNAHTHTHTHRHTPAGASWRQHVDAASAYPPGPTPRGLRPSSPLPGFSCPSSFFLKTPPTSLSARASRRLLEAGGFEGKEGPD